MFLSVGKETVLALVLLIIMCSHLCMASEVAYAKFNEAISLKCTLNSNLSNIEWYHQKIGSTQDKTVYLEGTIYVAYKERFSVSCNERTCLLSISRVNSTDAGKYSCKYNEAATFVELIVFEVYPSNKSCSVPEEYNKTIIGENACNIALATVPISCKMKYYGNKVPEMVWTDDYKKITLDPEKDKRNDIIDSTVQLIAVSTTKITCTIQFLEPNITSNIHWTKDVKVVALLNSSTKDITNCSSGDQICQIVENCYQPQWTFPNGTFINSPKTLALKDLESGDYECNNICLIRGQNCVIRQRTINYVCNTNDGSATETSNTANTPGIVIGIPVTVIAVLAVLAVAVILICMYKRKKHQENDQKGVKPDVAKHLTSPNENEEPGP